MFDRECWSVPFIEEGTDQDRIGRTVQEKKPKNVGTSQFCEIVNRKDESEWQGHDPIKQSPDKGHSQDDVQPE